MIFYENTYI